MSRRRAPGRGRRPLRRCRGATWTPRRDTGVLAGVLCGSTMAHPDWHAVGRWVGRGVGRDAEFVREASGDARRASSRDRAVVVDDGREVVQRDAFVPRSARNRPRARDGRSGRRRPLPTARGRDRPGDARRSARRTSVDSRPAGRTLRQVPDLRSGPQYYNPPSPVTMQMCARRASGGTVSPTIAGAGDPDVDSCRRGREPASRARQSGGVSRPSYSKRGSAS